MEHLTGIIMSQRTNKRNASLYSNKNMFDHSTTYKLVSSFGPFLEIILIIEINK